MNACLSWIKTLPVGACTALVLLAAPARVDAQTLEITVSASADPAYVQASALRDHQTYHFFEGYTFKADFVDPSIEKLTFEQIARSVAEALKKNRYYPAKDKNGGDLLIMISWGTTEIDQSWNDMLGVTDLGNASTPDGEEPADEPDSWKGQSGYRGKLNERLLGYAKGVQGKTSKAELEARREDLSEERYFIVLNAFDLAHLRKTSELKQVWSSRYSVRNRGTNLIFALDRLNQAAAPSFGKNLDDLHRETIDVKATVKLGEAEVLGYEETTTSSGSTAPEAQATSPATDAEKN